MKRLSLACLGFLALTTAAFAADLPRPAYKAPAYVNPAFSWTGIYVGINGGYAWGNSSWTPTAGAGTGDFRIQGPMVGGTLGYNLQTGNFVFGLETDLDWSNIKGSTTNAVCAGGTCETKNTWFGTARGRIGYAFDRFLPYITGGLAYGNLKIASGAGGSASSNFRAGWTVGGGVEYAITNAWSVKAEYLYADLGKATCDSTCSGGVPFDVTFKTNIVRAGVNYRF